MFIIYLRYQNTVFDLHLPNFLIVSTDSPSFRRSVVHSILRLWTPYSDASNPVANNACLRQSLICCGVTGDLSVITKNSSRSLAQGPLNLMYSFSSWKGQGYFLPFLLFLIFFSILEILTNCGSDPLVCVLEERKMKSILFLLLPMCTSRASIGCDPVVTSPTLSSP